MASIEKLALALTDRLGAVVGVSVVVVVGSLVGVSVAAVESLVVVSVVVSVPLLTVSAVVASLGTGTSSGVSKVLATSLACIAPIWSDVSSALDVSGTSDAAKTVPTLSFRLESAVTTPPIASVSSAAIAAAASMCLRSSRGTRFGKRERRYPAYRCHRPESDDPPRSSRSPSPKLSSPRESPSPATA